MKTNKINLLLSLFLCSCNSEVTISKTSDSIIQEQTILEKHFSKDNDDNFENFFGQDWSMANAKFGSHSVILLEDNTHIYGSGYLRTPSLGDLNQISVSLNVQLTGFNNAPEINKFLGQTCSFNINLLDNENNVLVENAMEFTHTITQDDCDNKYIAPLKPYTTNPNDSKTLIFKYQGNTTFNKIRINYLNKPHYLVNNKDNGVNLEIFSIVVKTI